jgi:glycosyltransferase involved in cell wall biosynthesis
MKKLLVVSVGDINKASSRARVFWVFPRINKLQTKIKVSNNPLDILILFFTVHNYQIIIFQKVFSRWHLYLLWYLKYLGKSIYLDIDDFPSRSFSEVTLKNFQRFSKSVHGISCGNINLLNYCLLYNKNSFLIPTCIDVDLYGQYNSKLNDKKVIVGWIGNGSHYEEELIWFVNEIVTPLTKHYLETPLQFCFIGVKNCKKLFSLIESLKLTDKFAMIEDLNWSDTQEVSSWIGKFDIGIYPLLEQNFNLYKCGFKALEYGACGVPTVASNILGMNAYINNGVTGMLCDKSDDWISQIRLLIHNTKLRNEIGFNAQMHVRNEYSVKKAVSIWENKMNL